MESFVTLEDLRRQVYAENVGQQLIAVQRDEFACQVVGVYKDPSINLLLKPQVAFLGEPGRDVGALTKEFFWTGIQALNSKINNLMAFEGADDCRVPSCDAILLRSGIFKTIGKFMSHSCLHTGIAFIGLSKSVGEYLTAEQITPETPISIIEEDIPDYDIQQAVVILNREESVNLADDEKAVVNSAMVESGLYEPLNISNRAYITEHLMYFSVIERRRAQLNDLREGFQSTPVYAFLQSRNYLLPSVFPKNEELVPPLSVILSKLECEGENNDVVLNLMKEYITSISADARQVTDLLKCWTGWGVIPDGKLKIDVHADHTFRINTCFRQIQVPSFISSTDLNQNMRMAVAFAVGGFGSV